MVVHLSGHPGGERAVTGCTLETAAPLDAGRDAPLVTPYCFFSFDYSLHGMVRGGKTLLDVFARPQPEWTISVADPRIATARCA